MRILGKEITAEKVVAKIESRLRERGLLDEPALPIQISGVEPRVDPLSFNLRALEENVDPTLGLPIQTHRTGISGQTVVAVKMAFRKAGRVLITELLGRQRVFNAHVLDSYAQLSAEVLKLRDEVQRLKTESRQEAPAPKVAAPKKRQPPPKKKTR